MNENIKVEILKYNFLELLPGILNIERRDLFRTSPSCRLDCKVRGDFHLK